LRERYEVYRQMPAEDRVRLRQEFRRFRDLPPQHRARLREQFEQMSPAERRAFLMGAQAREAAAAARRAFAFVPPAERVDTWQMLRQLDPEARQLLRRIVSRLDPEERDALRRELLTTDPEGRLALLRERARRR
jgi:hypothetical protein